MLFKAHEKFKVVACLEDAQGQDCRVHWNVTAFLPSFHMLPAWQGRLTGGPLLVLVAQQCMLSIDWAASHRVT